MDDDADDDDDDSSRDGANNNPPPVLRPTALHTHANKGENEEDKDMTTLR
eukprot:m.4761 g.4761  ORF g.4761 m.4761 type:complete len:50 (+) comp3975_c0_seq1:661-810(+)